MIFKNFKSKTFYLFLFIIANQNIYSNYTLKRITLSSRVIFFSKIQKDSTSINNKYNKVFKKFKQELYTESLKESLIILEECKNNKNYEYAYLVSELIGEIYDKTYESNKALKYYKISLKNLLVCKSNRVELTNKLSETDNSLGKIQLRISGSYLKKYENLKTEYLENLKKINNKSNTLKLLKKYRDSALYYSKLLENIPSLNDQIQKYKAISYTNLSGLYFLDSIYKKAEFFAKKAVKIHKKRNDKKRIASSLNNLGNVYLSYNNFQKAKETYSEAIETIKNDKSFEAIKFKTYLFGNLAWTMRNMEEIEAYDNLETSYKLEDNLRQKDFKRIIKKIESNHKENLEQQKIDLVNSQTELLKAQQDKSTLLVSILSILGLIISGVVIYNYRLRQNNLQLKLSQNKLIEEQNIDRIKSESQIKILNATIDGKETERKQIAETLHDSVSALLSSANMHLRATKKQFNGNTPVELEKTQQIILEASQKVRDLSHNLVSSILLKFGLGYAIKDIGSKYSNSELHFHTNISNISRYNQEFEIKLYNVIHELINNILKHSKASNAHIVLEDKNGFLSVLIEDDGIGFNYKDNKIKTGLGLNQIEARIQMMNGNFLIESAKEKGTKATITVPIKNKSLVTA